MPKNLVWLFDMEMYLEIIELAQKHGKKPGDSMKEEFEEVMKKYPEKCKLIGETDKDKDVFTGDLREEGLRVLNVDEEERRKNNRGDE